ncbi:hypothetical protein RIR_jg39757.t1 [Rhizophagus irregularis DAOM 181602=DAOM 197198]|uniref:Uncharacterized protein n=1 Tax=Rhizophagus irregularis (strain DAOM 181602 / DAOM 197198 / MUCL 43194) TaxID=747089 RepID=U9TUT4_RHIID|nr:hypothetical protein RIR_jg39757.t1 [Rhizophagus irregularis DAOM 181602=DAOM 197198]
MENSKSQLMRVQNRSESLDPNRICDASSVQAISSGLLVLCIYSGALPCRYLLPGFGNFRMGLLPSLSFIISTDRWN